MTRKTWLKGTALVVTAALALVFGMTVVGCGGEPEEEFHRSVEIKNGSLFDIKYVALYDDYNVPFLSDPIGIKSGQTKTYRIDDSYVDAVELVIKVGSKDVRVFGDLGDLDWDGYGTLNLSGSYHILLSGTSEDTLKLSGY
jgi:hypothetical protein